MKIRHLVLATFVLASGTVYGQDSDGDEMEATMRLMGNAEAELPDAVIKTIELPEALLTKHPDSPAIDASADGHGKAAERHARRDAGLDQADLARDRGADMSQKAAEDRENLGRSDDRPEPPENPGAPDDLPGPPGN